MLAGKSTRSVAKNSWALFLHGKTDVIGSIELGLMIFGDYAKVQDMARHINIDGDFQSGKNFPIRSFFSHLLVIATYRLAAQIP